MTPAPQHHPQTQPASHGAQPAAGLCFHDARVGLGEFELATGAIALPTGSVTVLLGANGSGKTTVLRMAAGLLAPREGDVRLGADPIARMPARVRARRIAYVPQRALVGAPFTVRQVVELGRHALPQDADRVTAALESVHLAHRAQEPFHRLSIGQQQRVVLARALAQLVPGGALLLDETLAPVDPPETHRLVQVVRSLAAAGATVLLATHDLSLAAAAGDWAWYLSHGKTQAFGRSAEVLAPARLAQLAGVPVVGAQGSRGLLPVPDLTAMLHREP